MARIYTRRGDDGTTGLLFGGRVTKDSMPPEAYGSVDEAVAALGLARALAEGQSAERILEVQRDLFVVGAELATAAANRPKLEPGVSAVTPEMVQRLEGWIDELTERVGMPEGFVVSGGTQLSASLELSRAITRRAERRAVAWAVDMEGSQVVPYLNRLADYLYMLARATESDWVPSRDD